MNLKQQLVAFLFATSLLPAYKATAQKTEPIFEIPVGNLAFAPKFLLQASTGELITGNEFKLVSIDPEKKVMLWENKDLLGLEEDDISIIDGTPFIKIERRKSITVSNNKNTYIIQARDGKIVYDSKDEGIKVRNTLIIPSLNGLLVESVKDGLLSVSMIDFAAAKQSWTVPLAQEKTGGIGIGALKRAIKSYMNSAFNVAPATDADGNLILVYKKEIFAIAKTGNIAWKKQYDENVDDAYMTTDKKALFIGYKKYIDKLSTADGKSLLKEPIKMRDELNGITPMGNDYIVYNEAGINLMDAGGNMKWEKDSKLGNITEVRFTEDGILAIQKAKDDETVFSWVDKNGKRVWDETVKGGFTLAEPTAKGVMYVTTERANILTYEKGKDVWNKDIKLKGKANFGIDAGNKILYAYANEKLHAFNFTDVTYRLVAEDLAFKKFNAEEETLTFDCRKNGATVIISANQNVASFQSADGKINYNNYFKDIGNTKKKLLKIASVAVQAYGAGKAIQGGVNMNQGFANALTTGNTSQFVAGYDQRNQGESLNQLGTDMYNEASKRYLASQATKDNLYILSEMPEGNGLMVWNKEKGEATKKILFPDTSPIFVVDEATDRVYVLVRDVLKAYDLK